MRCELGSQQEKFLRILTARYQVEWLSLQRSVHTYVAPSFRLVQLVHANLSISDPQPW